MFTDELMEQDYNQNHDIRRVFKILLERVFDAGNKNKEHSTATIPAGKIQQANNIWKLFAKRHSELKADGFKNILLTYYPDKADYIDNILK